MKNIKNSQKNNKPAMLVALLAVFVVINIFPTRAPVQVEPPRRQLQPVTAAEVLAGAEEAAAEEAPVELAAAPVAAWMVKNPE